MLSCLSKFSLHKKNGVKWRTVPEKMHVVLYIVDYLLIINLLCSQNRSYLKMSFHLSDWFISSYLQLNQRAAICVL